ncbi:MAG: hypothetical protein ACRDOO_24155 [Actinomadura sp.]
MAESMFASELNQLLAVGKVTLPHLAWTYATLNNRVADTAGYDNAAFAACPATAGWTQDRLHGTWTSLRDRLQDILGRSAQSFEAAADAMVRVAASYEAADAHAAAEVRAAWRDGAPYSVVSLPEDRRLPPPPPRVIIANK